MDDFTIPDNEGNQPQGEPIVEDGPAGYFSTLPLYALVDRLNQASIPSTISNTAGLYLCNRLFYCVMHCIAVEQLPIRAGFIHLPGLHDQIAGKWGDRPSMSRETLIEAMRIVIETSLQEGSAKRMRRQDSSGIS